MASSQYTLCDSSSADYVGYNDVRRISAQSAGIAGSLLRTAGELFVKHRIEDQYGVMLLHRHFDLEQGRVMASFRYSDDSETCTMVPWTTWLHPTSYLLAPGNRFKPFEFSHEPAQEPSTEFLHDLGAFLVEHKLSDLLGLTRIHTKKHLWLESQLQDNTGTIARVVERIDNIQGVDTVWGFVKNGASLDVVSLRKCETQSSGGHKIT